jgi:hypothetical protein
VFLAGGFRVQASAFWDLPIAHFGRNDPALLGGALLLMRGFP